MNTAKHLLEGKEYEFFHFDKPATVKLPNGTEHRFKVWNVQAEKRREDLLKTIVIESPAVINGENPRDVKTDYSRSQIAYYDDMIEAIRGVGFADNDPNEWLPVDSKVIIDDAEVLVKDLIPARLKKQAASRLYSGNVELEKVSKEEDSPDFDPFADDFDIDAEVARQEAEREVFQLSLNRQLIIRQELGSEQLNSGAKTPPTHVIRYYFRELEAKDFSTWEMKSSRGYSISLNKGGSRSERFYNLDAIDTIFNEMVERIEGACVGNEVIQLSSDRKDSQRRAILGQIPLLMKKLTVATLFQEASNLGNF